MNSPDTGIIFSLPLSDKEKTSKSWKKSCYNAYVSWYFLDFKLLEEELKEAYLISCGVWSAPVVSISDKDSTRTPPTYRPHHVMKVDVRQWHSLSEEVKATWKKRSVKLNMLPVVKFTADSS
eukprot:7028747-Ditylum_brightwellii.AAC.1